MNVRVNGLRAFNLLPVPQTDPADGFLPAQSRGWTRTCCADKGGVCHAFNGDDRRLLSELQQTGGVRPDPDGCRSFGARPLFLPRSG